MDHDNILAITRICLAADSKAAEVYARLSETGGSGGGAEELRAFWSGMAKDERTHVDFWEAIKKAAEERSLPDVFDDPVRTRQELERMLARVDELVARWEATENVADAFLLSFRLEFYMMHPAFELLYHTLKPIAGGVSPSDEYDNHINKFVEMFGRHGSVSPETELLGDTLQTLWKRNRVLAELATIDTLTGVLSRRGFFVFAKQLAYLAQRNKENVGILMIDIDDFKKINDAHGHQKGDEVLKGVALALKAGIRKSDIAGRYGGEEFIIMFPAIQPGALQLVAEVVRREVETSKPAGIQVTVSIGAAQGDIHSDPDLDLKSLIMRADECLYTAKSGGKNRVVKC